MATEHVELATLSEQVEDFLAQQRIAVAGVSAARETPDNLIYRKLKTAGYQVFGVSSTAETFDGDPCYPDLPSIPGGGWWPGRGADLWTQPSGQGVGSAASHQTTLARTLRFTARAGVQTLGGSCRAWPMSSPATWWAGE